MITPEAAGGSMSDDPRDGRLFAREKNAPAQK